METFQKELRVLYCLAFCRLLHFWSRPRLLNPCRASIRASTTAGATFRGYHPAVSPRLRPQRGRQGLFTRRAWHDIAQSPPRAAMAPL